MVEYETDIGDSGKRFNDFFSFLTFFAVDMEIDPDPEKQRCEGILSATGSAGADVGSRVRVNIDMKFKYSHKGSLHKKCSIFTPGSDPPPPLFSGKCNENPKNKKK